MASPYLENERDRLARRLEDVARMRTGISRSLEDIARMNVYVPPMEDEVKPKERFLTDFAITLIAILSFAVAIPALLFWVSV